MKLKLKLKLKLKPANSILHGGPLLFGGLICPPPPACTCGAGIMAAVHWGGCDPQFIFNASPPEKKPATPPGLILPHGVAPLRKPRPSSKKGAVKPWPKSYRFLLSFSFTRPVNIDLWKRIHAPRGWRKNPTTKEKQQRYRGVRFQCTDLKYALTPDEIDDLRARLSMILEEVF